MGGCIISMNVYPPDSRMIGFQSFFSHYTPVENFSKEPSMHLCKSYKELSTLYIVRMLKLPAPSTAQNLKWG